MNLEIKSDDYDGSDKCEILIPSEGDKRLQALETCLARLDNNKYRRSKDQKVWHSAWTQACLFQIYNKDEKDFEAKVGSLSKKITRNLLIQGPQMIGKKMGLCMFLAAYLWTQKSASVLVLTPGARHSSMLIHKTLSMLPFILPDTEKTPIILNKGHYCLQIRAADGTKSILNTAPAVPSRLRGIGRSDIMIVYKPELFQDLSVIRETVIPLSFFNNSTTWIISAVRTCQAAPICLKLPDQLYQSMWVFKTTQPLSARHCTTCYNNNNSRDCVNCDICRSSTPSTPRAPPRWMSKDYDEKLTKILSNSSDFLDEINHIFPDDGKKNSLS